jgi:hypothetical protein
MTAEQPQKFQDSKLKSILIHVLWILPLLGLIAGSVYFYNYFTLQIPANNVLTMDGRNTGLVVSVRYENMINFNVINFSLENIKDNSHEDIIRALFQYAWVIKTNGHEFEKVYLNRQGERKFMLEGSYFSKLGDEYNKEDPMVLVFSVPANLYYPDGQRVYRDYNQGETETGDDLILATRQLKDVNEFMKRWMYE